MDSYSGSEKFAYSHLRDEEGRKISAAQIASSYLHIWCNAAKGSERDMHQQPAASSSESRIMTSLALCVVAPIAYRSRVSNTYRTNDSEAERKRGSLASGPDSGKRLKAGQDSRQILQLSTLVTLLRPEMLVVRVQLLQLQLLLLVTAVIKTDCLMI